MRVPFLDLSFQNKPPGSRIRGAISGVLGSERYVLGPEAEWLESELSRYIRCSEVVSVSSGTDALLLSLMALGVGSGDEVVTTPFTFFATAGAIARLGATPVFADIDPHTFNMPAGAARALVNRRTKAVVPVHLFGRPAEHPDVPVPVVEDAAQAIGVPVRGHLSCLSFFPSKNLGAFGDAGAVCGGDETLIERVRLLRSHGASPKYEHHVVGCNSRMDELQAAVLRVKLLSLDKWIAMRRENASRYRDMFASRAGIPQDLQLPDNSTLHSYNQFVIRAPSRDRLRRHLKESGVSTEVYYPKPLHLQPCFTNLGYGRGDLPEAERAADEVLALPIFPGLSEWQQAHVVDSIARFYEGPNRR